ncbi:hypothetical protein IscW_ISCW010060 [Ixodes scapularis]|uniref:Uncharacterized protein n=1 Tax=Ixodes scapularis TaxID=6945 RepID=B7Q1R8_IXOSC|nr:hypothetical protein IscW_ISCW010060 [Ixodes scapularis]|eukprot:XP_002410033.1 hypothetical protein IscW_ISCW010060 [Ixodes scapularis]
MWRGRTFVCEQRRTPLSSGAVLREAQVRRLHTAQRSPRLLWGGNSTSEKTTISGRPIWERVVRHARTHRAQIYRLLRSGNLDGVECPSQKNCRNAPSTRAQQPRTLLWPPVNTPHILLWKVMCRLTKEPTHCTMAELALSGATDIAERANSELRLALPLHEGSCSRGAIARKELTL